MFEGGGTVAKKKNLKNQTCSIKVFKINLNK